MVQKESYWLELSHYIVLYPVRAGITDQVIVQALASLFLGKYCKKPILGDESFISGVQKHITKRSKRLRKSQLKKLFQGFLIEQKP